MIHLSNISKQYGSQIIFIKSSLQILPGVRTGLVGPNGAGKSTIFRLITGVEEADKGEISCSKK
ncbi:MAG: ABC-F family ATP-binding cassette domain-containing protein, partial [Desulfocapsa sp.]|nr:ABC-F family ATP-binding cassette domain-containing protein [Desulfocapsa sp.]